MQRLARFKLQEINQNVTALFVHYDEIIKILRSHLPPSTATLFAKPEIKADQVTVEWYSELEGQPVLITQEMQEDKRFKPTISLIQQRLNAIMTLNQELMTKGVLTPEQSAWLAQLVEGATHDTCQIYLVNNEPVITGWGIGKKVEPPKEEPKVEEPKPEPKKNCRVVEKPTDAPQLAIIFNNASGMRYTLLESAKKVAIFDEKLRNPAKYGITQQDVYYMYRKPNRSVASKKSVAELINNIPTAVDIGLVELKSCLSTSKKASYATNHGIFTAAQRSTLKAKLNKMQVRENQVPGTPIYEGLQKALTIIDGKEREALIVLITEGNGDCTNRNVCELIKKEAKERPKLKINIVNINSPWHNTDCLAKTTGGEILNGDMTNQVKLTEAIKKSMEPVQQEICDE